MQLIRLHHYQNNQVITATQKCSTSRDIVWRTKDNNPITNSTCKPHSYFRSVFTMDFTFSFFRSVYDCPHPTNITGAPDIYTIDSAAPTYNTPIPVIPPQYASHDQHNLKCGYQNCLISQDSFQFMGVAYLIINCIELSEQDSIYQLRIWWGWEIS